MSDRIRRQGLTLRAAHAALGEFGDGHLTKPRELVEVTFASAVAPSLVVRRSLTVLLARALTDSASERHRITKAELRRGHKSNERIGSIVDALSGLRLDSDDLSSRGRRSLRRTPVFVEINEEVSDGDNAWIEYELHPQIRKIIENSEVFARIKLDVVMNIKSKYSLAIYERGCLFCGRAYPVWKISIDDFKRALCIGNGEHRTWSSLSQKVLRVAEQELSPLVARFRFEFRPIFDRANRRKVVAIELSFWPPSENHPRLV